jgi:two-component system sensor histidine kinase KdpD
MRLATIMLDKAKVECDALGVQTETVPLADVIGAAIKDATGVLRDCTTDVILPSALPALNVDPAILSRALVMLIEHAVRHIPSGSMISIQAAADARLVFDRSLAGSRERGLSSADIDLVTCRDLIEATGGAFSASNRTDGSGAVSTITFPSRPQRPVRNDRNPGLRLQRHATASAQTGSRTGAKTQEPCSEPRELSPRL